MNYDAHAANSQINSTENHGAPREAHCSHFAIAFFGLHACHFGVYFAWLPVFHAPLFLSFKMMFAHLLGCT